MPVPWIFALLRFPSVRLITVLLLLPIWAAAENISVRMEAGRFLVTGWSPGGAPSGGWASLFSVYAGEGDVPPMLGSYAVEEGSLVFRPRFPIAAGVQVRAVFRPPGGSAVTAVFDPQKRESRAASTRVQH